MVPHDFLGVRALGDLDAFDPLRAEHVGQFGPDDGLIGLIHEKLPVGLGLEHQYHVFGTHSIIAQLDLAPGDLLVQFVVVGLVFLEKLRGGVGVLEAGVQVVLVELVLALDEILEALVFGDHDDVVVGERLVVPPPHSENDLVELSAFVVDVLRQALEYHRVV